MLAVLGAPSRYVQGRNATNQLGAEMKALGFGGMALVVAGKSARQHLADVEPGHDGFARSRVICQQETERVLRQQLLVDGDALVGEGDYT